MKRRLRPEVLGGDFERLPIRVDGDKAGELASLSPGLLFGSAIRTQTVRVHAEGSHDVLLFEGEVSHPESGPSCLAANHNEKPPTAYRLGADSILECAMSSKACREPLPIPGGRMTSWSYRYDEYGYALWRVRTSPQSTGSDLKLRCGSTDSTHVPQVCCD